MFLKTRILKEQMHITGGSKEHCWVIAPKAILLPYTTIQDNNFEGVGGF